MSVFAPSHAMHARSLRRAERLFHWAAASLLFPVAISKYPVFLEDNPYYRMTDYSLPALTNGPLYRLAVILECLVATHLLVTLRRGRYHPTNYVPTICLSGLFATYQVLARAVSSPTPCECLGILPKLVPMSRDVRVALPCVMILLLASGGCAILASRRNRGNEKPGPGSQIRSGSGLLAFVLATGLILATGNVRATAAAVRLTGLASTEVLDTNRNRLPENVRKHRFSVDVDDQGRWLAEVEADDGYGVVEYHGFDGTDCFFLRYPGPRKHPVWDRSTDHPVAQIAPGPIYLCPLYMEDPVRFSIWIAYGSSAWLRGDRGSWNPWLKPTVSLLGHGYGSRIDVRSELPGLPESGILFRDNGKDRPLEEENEGAWIRTIGSMSDLLERKRQHSMRGESLTNGQVVVEWASTNWMTAEGLRIPRKTELLALEPGSHWWRHVLEVETVEPSKMNDFRPPIRGHIVTVDVRARARTKTHALDSIRYVVNATNRWAPATDRALARLYQGSLASSPRVPLSFFARNRAYVFGLLAILTLVLPVYYFRRSR